MNLYGSFDNIGQVLSATSVRQQVISNNIANAQTPHYTAKSISFSEILAQTNSPFETRLSQKMGNNMGALGPNDTGAPVDLKQEMLEVQKNTLIYSMATRRMSSIFNSLRTASQIGR